MSYPGQFPTQEFNPYPIPQNLSLQDQIQALTDTMERLIVALNQNTEAMTEPEQVEEQEPLDMRCLDMPSLSHPAPRE